MPIISQSSQRQAPDSIAAPAGGDCSLLVIEDTLIHSTLIARIADKIGFTTQTASSYDDACNLLYRRQYDCITLDLGLGQHVGAEVFNHLAKLRCKSRIIVISGSEKAIFDETVRIGKSLELNVCEAMSKPIDLKKLREVLEHIRMQSELEKLATGTI